MKAKKMMNGIVVGVVMAMIVACQSAEHERMLACAEGYVETRPDSTLYWLEQVKDTLSLCDEHRARYALLWTQALHKLHRPLPDDSIIDVAVKYYTKSGEQKRLARTWLYKGLVHKAEGDVASAMEAFAQSELCYEGVEDNQYKGLLYNHYATLLKQQELFEEALDYFKKTYVCELKGDSLHYVTITCQEIALMYRLLNQLDSAECYYQRAFAYKDRINVRAYSSLIHSYGAFMTDIGRYEEAEELLHQGLVRTENSPNIYRVYGALADLYRKMERHETARDYAMKMTASPDSGVVEIGYLLLSKACKALGDKDGALHYNNLYRQYSSDLAMRLQTAEVARIPHEVRHRWLMQEKRKTEHKAWLLVTGLIAVTGGAIAIGRWRRRKHRKEMVAKSDELREMAGMLDQKDRDYQKRNVDAAVWKEACRKREVSMGKMQAEAMNQKVIREELKNEIRQMQAEAVQAGKRESALQRELEAAKRETEKEQKRRMKSEKRLEVLELLRRFIVDGNSLRTVSLVMECISQQKNLHLQVSSKEYVKTLQPLVEYKQPGLSEKLQALATDERDLIVCYLLAIGVEEVEALAYGIHLSVKSAYPLRKKWKAVLDRGKNDGFLF